VASALDLDIISTKDKGMAGWKCKCVTDLKQDTMVHHVDSVSTRSKTMQTSNAYGKHSKSNLHQGAESNMKTLT
jgi:hypothetical protein